jgi:hypothetical protein
MATTPRNKPSDTILKYRALAGGLVSSIIILGFCSVGAMLILADLFPRMTTEGALVFARGFSIASITFTILFWTEFSVVHPRKLQKLYFSILFIGITALGYWIFPPHPAVASYLGATAFYSILICLTMMLIDRPLRWITTRPKDSNRSLFVYKLFQFSLIWIFLVLQMALWK